MDDRLASSAQLPHDLLDRWVSGTPTDDDQARIASFVAERPQAKALLHALNGDGTASVDIAQLWQHVADAMRGERQPAPGIPAWHGRWRQEGGRLGGRDSVARSLGRMASPRMLAIG